MSSTATSTTRFPLGKIVMTDGVASLVQLGYLDAQYYLERHGSADWGDVPPDRQRANDRAIYYRELLFSRYLINPSLRLYVITEGDRSVTSLLLVPRVALQN